MDYSCAATHFTPKKRLQRPRAEEGVEEGVALECGARRSILTPDFSPPKLAPSINGCHGDDGPLFFHPRSETDDFFDGVSFPSCTCSHFALL
ncbi:hypothetical protein TNCV_589711 [Trichonephila clavipes]|nr:hypothetical protein TNCV_589711 [Trichonephila clavipes]